MWYIRECCIEGRQANNKTCFKRIAKIKRNHPKIITLLLMVHSSFDGSSFFCSSLPQRLVAKKCNDHDYDDNHNLEGNPRNQRSMRIPRRWSSQWQQKDVSCGWHCLLNWQQEPLVCFTRSWMEDGTAFFRIIDTRSPWKLERHHPRCRYQQHRGFLFGRYEHEKATAP